MKRVGFILQTLATMARNQWNRTLNGVYRIDGNGSVHLVAANASQLNGIAISPDQKTLYVANNDYPGNNNFWVSPNSSQAVKPTPASGLLMAYDIQPNGNLRFKRNLIDFGNPSLDGMAVDKEGNLYVAVWGRVTVFSPDGNKITEIKLPQARNLCFGTGRFSKTLFIAAGTGIYMIESKKEGYNLPYGKKR